MGLAQYFYTASRILPFIVFIYFIFKIIQKREFLLRYYKGFVVLFVSFFFAFAPLELPIEKKFWHFQEGPSRTFIFGGSWAAHYTDRLNSGESHLHILGDQIVRSFLSFNFYLDRGLFIYGDSSGPMLEFLTSIFFVFGLSYIVFTWKKSANLLLLIAFFVTVMGLVALTIDPPTYYRMVILFSLPFIFAAVGIWKFFEYLGEIIHSRRFLFLTLCFLLLILGWSNYQRYFSVYSKSKPWAMTRDPATQISYFVKSLDPSFKIYVPSAYIHLPWTMKIILENTPYNIDYRPLSKILQDLETNIGKAVFILIPEQANNLGLLQKKFPGGTTRSLSDDFQSVKIYKIE